MVAGLPGNNLCSSFQKIKIEFKQFPIFQSLVSDKIFRIYLKVFLHKEVGSFLFSGASFPPQRISVKKIRLIDVKKSGLFERSEFPDFSQLM